MKGNERKKDKRILAIANILPKETSHSKITGKLESIERIIIDSKDNEQQLDNQLRLLMNGGKGIEPLDHYFTTEYPPSLKKQVVAILCAAFKTNKGLYGYLRWIEGRINHYNHDSEVVLWYLKLLENIFEKSASPDNLLTRKVCQESLIPFLMKELEYSDNNAVCLLGLGLIESIIELHPESLIKYFKKLIRLFIGLTVDAAISLQVREKASELLLKPKINSSWSNELKFCIELLESLISDVNDTITSSQDQKPRLSVLELGTCETLLQVLLTESNLPKLYQNPNDIIQVCSTLLKLSTKIAQKSMNNEWGNITIKICSRIVNCFPQVETILSTVQNFISNLGEGIIKLYSENKDYSIISDWINSMEYFCTNSAFYLTADVAQLFIEPSGSIIFESYRTQILESPPKLQKLASVSSNIMKKLWDLNTIENIPIMNELQIICNSNLKTFSLSQKIALCQFNLKVISSLCNDSITMSKKICEYLITVKVDSSALKYILKKSILEISVNVGFFLPKISIKPSIQEIPNQGIINYIVKSLEEDLKSNHFNVVIFATTILKHLIQSLEGKNTLEARVEDSFVLSHLENLVLTALRESAFQNDHMIRIEFAEVTKLYLNFFELNRRGNKSTPMFLHYISMRLNDINVKVRKAFYECICCIDPFDTMISAKRVLMERDLLNEFKHLVMKLPFGDYFRINHFHLMLSYLGMNQYISDQNNFGNLTCSLDMPLEQWLGDLFAVAQMRKNLASISPDGELFFKFARINTELLIYWGIWETAKLLISVRLKTILGPPMETLQIFENTLDQYLTVLRASEKEKNVDIDQFVELLKRFACFLQMLEFLELLVITAAKGSSEICPAAPTPSIIFFSTNFKSCSDWFNRIQSKTLQGAKWVMNYGLLLNKGVNELGRLLNLKDPNSLPRAIDLSNFVREQIFQINDSDNLVGLARTMKQAQFQNDAVKLQSIAELSWANALECDGMIETAITHYQALRTSSDENSNYINTVEKSLLRCFVGLSSWDDFDNLINQIPQSRINSYQPEIAKKQFAYKPLAGKRSSINVYFEHLSGQISEYLIPGPIKAPTQNNTFEEGNLDVHKTIMKRGIMDALEALAACGVAFRKLNGISDSDIMLNLRRISPFQSIFQNDILFSQVKNLLNVIEKKISSSVKIGKVAPSENLLSTSLDGKDLATWNLISSICTSNISNQNSDVDIMEIFHKLGNLAKYKRNMVLAAKAFNSSEWKNTSTSNIIRNLFLDGEMLIEEMQLEDGFGKMLEILELPHVEGFSYDLKLKAKACESFSRPEFAKIENLTSSKLAARIRQYLLKQNGNLELQSKSTSKSLVFGLLKEGSRLAPNYSKGWFKLGSFCYKEFRKMLDDLSEDCPIYFADELEKLEVIDSKRKKQIFRDLLIIFNESDILYANFWKEGLSQEVIDLVGNFMTKIEETIVRYLQTTVESYFQYLKIFSGSQKFGRKKAKLSTFSITATLRLLKIFSKYGQSLNEPLNQFFHTTPTDPWIEIAPQLFASLHHPDAIVRNEIKNLLIRIGKQNFQAVIYPVILGNEENGSTAIEAYNEIIKELMPKNEQQIIKTREFIFELQRISVLWSETWSVGLEHICFDFKSRHLKIKSAVKRISVNNTLAPGEKENIQKSTISNLLRPIAFSFEKLIFTTFEKKASTPYELDFSRKFQKNLELLLLKLQEACSLSDVGKLEIDLKNSLQAINEFNRKQELPLQYISPYLSKISDEMLSIPVSGGDINVLISHCCEKVIVLPSKTKPKHIQLAARNGKNYHFLLKGNEDLHLDERIQQFMRICNLFLSADRECSWRGLSANTFNVIPFGNNFGMIEWITNVSGIYPLYRKRQSWEFGAANARNQDSTEHKQPPRPQELFLGKIRSAHDKGILDINKRKTWPSKEIIRIFEEIKRETPKDIISSALQCTSTSSFSWWEKSIKFSRSVAVSSIIGYVLGLGDRHLDNILIDLMSGEVTHIDFNVCFDKGNRLKVPELVPFRLTQNMINVIGPLGLSGTFRIACEHALRTLRDNREIFLSLLEAFIYDPLIDWTTSTGSEKQILNLNVNIGLFSSRIGETRSLFQDSLLVFPVMISTVIHTLDDLNAVFLEKKALNDELNQLMSLQENADATKTRIQSEIRIAQLFLDEIFLKLETTRDEFKFNCSNILSIYELDIMDHSKNPLQEYIKLPIVRNVYLKVRKDIKALNSEFGWYLNYLKQNSSQFSCDCYAVAFMLAKETHLEVEDLQNALHEIQLNLYRTRSDYLEHDSQLGQAAELCKVKISKLQQAHSYFDDFVEVKSPSYISGKRSDFGAISPYLFFIAESLLLVSDNDPDAIANFLGADSVDLSVVLNEILKADLVCVVENNEFLLAELKMSIITICIAVIRHWSDNFEEFTLQRAILDTLEQIELAKSTYELIISKFIDIFPKLIQCFIVNSKIFGILYNTIVEIASQSRALFDNQFKPEDYEIFNLFHDLKLGNHIDNNLKSIYICISEMLKSADVLHSSLDIKLKLKLRIFNMAGILFEEVKSYVENTELLNIDLTAEFSYGFGSTEILSLPEFSNTRACIKLFIDCVHTDAIIVPFTNICKILLKVDNLKLMIPAHSNTAPIVWPVSTRIEEVDLVHEYLNQLVSLNMIKLEEIKEITEYFVSIGFQYFKSEIKKIISSKILKIDKLLNIRKASRIRFQLIHATKILESYGGLDGLVLYSKFFDSLENIKENFVKYTSEYQKIRYRISNGEVSTLNLKEVDLYTSFIDSEIAQCENLAKFCVTLSKVENNRLPDEGTWRLNLKIIETMDSLMRWKKEFACIDVPGSSIQFLKDRMNELSIPISDSERMIETLIRKLINFFEKRKSKAESIIKIGETILVLAEGVIEFENVAAELVSLKNDWKLLCKYLKSIENSTKNYFQDPIMMNELISLLNHILIVGKRLYTNILNLEHLSEINTQSKISPENSKQVPNALNKINLKNNTGIKVLQHINSKLEGKIGKGKRLNVSGHVSQLINDATDSEKLAFMFEGWMAWI